MCNFLIKWNTDKQNEFVAKIMYELDSKIIVFLPQIHQLACQNFKKTKNTEQKMEKEVKI